MDANDLKILKTIASSFGANKIFFVLLMQIGFIMEDVLRARVAAINKDGGIIIGDLAVSTFNSKIFGNWCQMVTSSNCTATPEHQSIKCQKNGSDIHKKCENTTCNESKCECDDMYPWGNQTGSCSVLCGTGKLEFERSVLKDSKCRRVKLEGECTKEPCTTTTTTTTTSSTTTTTTSTTSTTTQSTTTFLESTESTKKHDTLLIIAIVSTVLCVIIFITVLVFLCSRRRQYRVEYYGTGTQRPVYSPPPSPQPIQGMRNSTTKLPTYSTPPSPSRYPSQDRSSSSKGTGPVFEVKSATISANLSYRSSKSSKSFV